MRVVSIPNDMDHCGVAEMSGSFAELAESREDVCLDLSEVGFLDLAGVGQIASLSEALRRRSLRLALVRASGQPLHLLRQSLLEAFGDAALARLTS